MGRGWTTLALALLVAVPGATAVASPGAESALAAADEATGAAGATASETETPEAETPEAAEPPCLGSHMRFPNASLFRRTLCDFSAMPQSVSKWGAGQWLTAGSLALSVAVLMYPANPSLDARLSFRIDDIMGPDRVLWTPIGSALMWAFVWAIPTGTTFYGWFTGHTGAVEFSSLMVEALLVSRFIQVFLKFFIGREGPLQGDGYGLVLGPGYGWRFFPEGTPSGHATTLYALIGVVSAFFGDAWLTVLLQAGGAIFAASLVVDRLHFLSDVIWGAALGWTVGRWVVDHRRAKPEKGGGVDLTILPFADPVSGAAGLALGGRF